MMDNKKTEKETIFVKCFKCGGSGVKKIYIGFDAKESTKEYTCDVCDGTGRIPFEFLPEDDDETTKIREFDG